MELQINYKNVDALIPYANNSRTHSKEQISQIAASIKEFGFTNPILLDGDNGIIAGHGRLLASIKLKLDTVPTIELSELSEAQKKAYIIADNKLALNADWDNELLAIEIDELQELDFDIDLLGFSNLEIIELIGEEDSAEQDNYTEKVEIPIYETIGDKPEIESLIDNDKTNELISAINDADIPQEEKDFLLNAANRHTVFNFEKIANYYAHSDKETQELMESSALVIIDFNKAIENGFVNMSDEMSSAYSDDYPDDE